MLNIRGRVVPVGTRYLWCEASFHLSSSARLMLSPATLQPFFFLFLFPVSQDNSLVMLDTLMRPVEGGVLTATRGQRTHGARGREAFSFFPNTHN